MGGRSPCCGALAQLRMRIPGARVSRVIGTVCTDRDTESRYRFAEHIAAAVPREPASRGTAAPPTRLAGSGLRGVPGAAGRAVRGCYLPAPGHRAAGERAGVGDIRGRANGPELDAAAVHGALDGLRRAAETGDLDR